LINTRSILKRRRGVWIAVAAGALLCGAVFADYWSARPADVQRNFVGREVCADCHREQFDLFAGSDHDRAMDVANDQTVLGDFDNATIEHDGMVSRMFRSGDKFMVHTEAEDGTLRDFEVKYVFGVDPLQQYMVEFDRPAGMPADQIARLQVLRISWDTKAKKWFYLRPPDVDDKLAPDDPLHWTGIAQRWQTMCAECHSTNLQTNFDTRSLTYHTTFSEIDVSCEACHGPASLHVELAQEKSLFWDRRHGYGLVKLRGDDARPQLETCAPCHSRRAQLSDEFLPGDPFCSHFNLETLREDTYFADGQIKDEVYVYGSFLQSKMHHKGIRCSDCHDPHSLQLKHPGNQVCTSCHQHSAGKYDVPSHHHHAVGTAGAMCVNCHMPERTYMDVDPRRDHSLRVPRPDLSVALGTPNACSQCHVSDRKETMEPSVRDRLVEYADWQALATEHPQVAEAIKQTDQWCDEACQRWYGDARLTPPHFGEAVTAFRRGQDGAVEQMLQLAMQPSENASAIARASILHELAADGAIDAQQAAQQTAQRILDSDQEDPLVMAAAINLFINSSDAQAIARALLPKLKSESRLVRGEAARVLTQSGAYRTLSGAEQASVDHVLDEFKTTVQITADRAGTHMAWALICEARGRYDEAIAAYETALRVEPTATGPRTNLASLLEQLVGQAPPTSQPAIIDRAKQLRQEELPLLGRDADLAPRSAAIQYRYGLALYLAGEMKQAMERLERAVDLEPNVDQFRQARDLLREKLAEP
jgi:tetratricopeptide (TPR) repeat protein